MAYRSRNWSRVIEVPLTLATSPKWSPYQLAAAAAPRMRTAITMTTPNPMLSHSVRWPPIASVRVRAGAGRVAGLPLKVIGTSLAPESRGRTGGAAPVAVGLGALLRGAASARPAGGSASPRAPHPSLVAPVVGQPE